MDLSLVKTGDGSNTLYNAQLNEHYHSVNGAIQESNHVFIDAAVRQHQKMHLNVLEIGFGTGLNALLTARHAQKEKINIIYNSLEPFPLSKSIVSQLKYSDQIDEVDLYETIHSSEWDQMAAVSEYFKLYKQKVKIEEVILGLNFDVVYFDAFAPDVQPELWTKNVFEKIFNAMNSGAILTTYSCKGDVRRSLVSVGFKVEKIPGPPGKREMIRAIKLLS